MGDSSLNRFFSMGQLFKYQEFSPWINFSTLKLVHILSIAQKPLYMWCLLPPRLCLEQSFDAK